MQSGYIRAHTIRCLALKLTKVCVVGLCGYIWAMAKTTLYTHIAQVSAIICWAQLMPIVASKKQALPKDLILTLEHHEETQVFIIHVTNTYGIH